MVRALFPPHSALNGLHGVGQARTTPTAVICLRAPSVLFCCPCRSWSVRSSLPSSPLTGSLVSVRHGPRPALFQGGTRCRFVENRPATGTPRARFLPPIALNGLRVTVMHGACPLLLQGVEAGRNVGNRPATVTKCALFSRLLALVGLTGSFTHILRLLLPQGGPILEISMIRRGFRVFCMPFHTIQSPKNRALVSYCMAQNPCQPLFNGDKLISTK